MKPGNIVVVLVGPRPQGNIGSTARAMKNCGLTRLRIVGGRRLGKEAKRFAVHAEDVLARSERFESLEPAIGDAVRVVGFSSKHYAVGPRPAALPEVAAELRAASQRGVVALLFGREDHGLLKDEIRRCTDLVRIPSDPDYSVLNLAQSVLLAGYEIALAPEGLRRSAGAAASPKLPRQRRQSVLAEFEWLLSRLDYGKPAENNLTARILRRLSAQFERSLAEESDLKLWMGLIKRLKQRI